MGCFITGLTLPCFHVWHTRKHKCVKYIAKHQHFLPKYSNILCFLNIQENIVPATSRGCFVNDWQVRRKAPLDNNTNPNSVL